MVKQRRMWMFVVVLLLTPLAACGGDDDDDDEGDKRPRPVAGNFVGEVKGTNAFVAVMTSPQRGRAERGVNVYVFDGRRISEHFRGSLKSNSFAAKSDDDDAEAKGELRRDAVTGTLKLPGRPKTVRYQASRATGGSGLYDLTISSGGKLRGTSAAGLLLKGDSTLPRPGKGTFKLVDGRRLRFVARRPSGGDSTRLRAGQVRLIVLPNGRLRGAGKTRGRGGSDVVIRSSK